jgi:hypothetical protein
MAQEESMTASKTGEAFVQNGVCDVERGREVVTGMRSKTKQLQTGIKTPIYTPNKPWDYLLLDCLLDVMNAGACALAANGYNIVTG